MKLQQSNLAGVPNENTPKSLVIIPPYIDLQCNPPQIYYFHEKVD